MKRLVTIACILVFGLVPGTALGQKGPGKLPGSTGPRMELLSATVAGVEILDVSVAPSPESGEPGQIFPPGTSSLRFTIRMKSLPAEGTQFAVDIVNQQGPVKREGYGSYSQVVDRKTGETEVSLSPPSTEPYPPGPYRATVKVGETKAAVLNWSIAAPSQ